MKNRTAIVMGDHSRICVGNLGYNVTEEQVKEALEQFGTVKAVKIPRGRNGRHKGCAIVDCETPEMADKVHDEIHEKEFLGRTCYISFDDDPKKEFRRDRERDSHHREDRDRDRYSRRYDRERSRDRDRHYRRERRRRYSYYSDDYDDYDHDRYHRRSRRDSPPRRHRSYSPEPRRREERRERRHSSSEDSS